MVSYHSTSFYIWDIIALCMKTLFRSMLHLSIHRIPMDTLFIGSLLVWWYLITLLLYIYGTTLPTMYEYSLHSMLPLAVYATYMDTPHWKLGWCSVEHITSVVQLVLCNRPFYFIYVFLRVQIYESSFYTQ